MGGAYSEGMIKYLQEQKIAVEQVVHLSPADPSGFTASSAPTMQFNLENDGVLLYKNFGENYMIPGVDRYGIASTTRGKSDDLQLSHRDTKMNNIWGMVGDLKTFKWILQVTQCQRHLELLQVQATPIIHQVIATELNLIF